MPKVLITIGDAAEAMDTLYPVYRVQEDGYEAVVAGPDARVYPLVMHEIPPVGTSLESNQATTSKLPWPFATSIATTMTGCS